MTVVSSATILYICFFSFFYLKISQFCGSVWFLYVFSMLKCLWMSMNGFYQAYRMFIAIFSITSNEMEFRWKRETWKFSIHNKFIESVFLCVVHRWNRKKQHTAATNTIYWRPRKQLSWNRLLSNSWSTTEKSRFRVLFVFVIWKISFLFVLSTSLFIYHQCNVIKFNPKFTLQPTVRHG